MARNVSGKERHLRLKKGILTFMQRQPLGFYQDNFSHVPLKVDVFTKIHQMTGVIEEIQKIINLPLAERRAWLDDHQHTTIETFRAFRDVIQFDMHDQEMDPEMVELLTEYSRLLKECSAVMFVLLPEVKLLEG